jgi:IclR family pca regulon transcriptional regulator
MTTLAKGLTVMRAFSGERATMTLSETAAVASLTRATARRILRTRGARLRGAERAAVALTPRCSSSASATSPAKLVDQAAAPEGVSASVQESCSAAILQDTDIVYVARIPTQRIMSAALTVGSRLPAFHTSLGRVQLGFVDEDEVWRRIRSLRIQPYTTQTITEPQALVDRIKADREQGFSIVDEELERGLRSIAVPIVDRRGAAVAGLNLSTNSTRITRNHMREHFLPRLSAVAGEISSFIA